MLQNKDIEMCIRDSIDARVEIQNDCKRRINKIIKLMSDKENNYNVLIRDEIKDQIQELRKIDVYKRQIFVRLSAASLHRRGAEPGSPGDLGGE